MARKHKLVTPNIRYQTDCGVIKSSRKLQILELAALYTTGCKDVIVPKQRLQTQCISGLTRLKQDIVTQYAVASSL